MWGNRTRAFFSSSILVSSVLFSCKNRNAHILCERRANRRNTYLRSKYEKQCTSKSKRFDLCFLRFVSLSFSIFSYFPCCLLLLMRWIERQWPLYNVKCMRWLPTACHSHLTITSDLLWLLLSFCQFLCHFMGIALPSFWALMQTTSIVWPGIACLLSYQCFWSDRT